VKISKRYQEEFFRVCDARVILPTISVQLYERKIQDKGNDNDRCFVGNILEAIIRQAATNGYIRPVEGTVSGANGIGRWRSGDAGTTTYWAMPFVVI
jgi:hypothetical protein